MLLFIAKFLSIFFLEILLIALVNKIFVAITHQTLWISKPQKRLMSLLKLLVLLYHLFVLHIGCKIIKIKLFLAPKIPETLIQSLRALLSLNIHLLLLANTFKFFQSRT